MGQEILSISSINTNSVPTGVYKKTATKTVDTDLPNLLSKSSTDIKTDEPLTDKTKTDLWKNNKSWIIGGGLTLGTIALAILTRGKFKPKEVLPPNVLKMPNGQKIITDIQAPPVKKAKTSLISKILRYIIRCMDKKAKKTYLFKTKHHKLFTGNVEYAKTTNIEELKNLADKLGILLPKGKYTPQGKTLKDVKYVLNTFARLYNQSKGKIKLPRKVEFGNGKTFGSIETVNGNGYAVAMSLGNSVLCWRHSEITKLMPRKLKTRFLLHELGHMNHNYRYPCTNIMNPHEMATYSKPSRLTMEFVGNKKLQKQVKEEVSRYAATSPAEFVAEMYSGLLQGKKYPAELMERYHMYKGPTNHRFMFK